MYSSDYRNKRLQYYDWWKKIFDQSVRNNLRTYDTIRKIATDQRDDCATIIISKTIIDVSKQQVLDTDPKVMQQI